MARSLNDIKQIITTKYVAEMAAIGEVVDPTTWSAVSIERLIIFVVSYCQFVLENLFDIFKQETNAVIAAKNPHTLGWYHTKIAEFQYGYSRVNGQDYYDNTGLTQAQIDASKIIAYNAVVEEQDRLIIKLAKLNGINLTPLANVELDALKADVKKWKDAGVIIDYVNTEADSLVLTMDVYYDPTIIDGNSQTEIVSGKPTVRLTNENYLKQLDFNGVFALQDLQDKLQAVPGVKYINFKTCNAKAFGNTAYLPVNVFYNPYSGYLRFYNPSDLVLNFIPYA